MSNRQFLRLPPLVWKLLNEATIDSVLLAAIEQFEDQATNRLLIAVLEEYEDSGTTQKKDVEKTPAKVLPSTLSKHCMCTTIDREIFTLKIICVKNLGVVKFSRFV